MAWIKLASDTLTSSGDNLINTVTTKKFMTSMFHSFETGGSAIPYLRYNNDSGTKYSQRQNTNGGAEELTTNITLVDFALVSLDTLCIMHTCNILGQEKLGVAFLIDSLGSGASTAPRRRESVHKYVPSPDADITEIRILNIDVGSFDVGANLITMGTSGGDVIPENKITTGCEFHETDTNKDYVWNGSAWVYITP